MLKKILLIGLKETCQNFSAKIKNYQLIFLPLSKTYKLDYTLPNKQIDWLILTSSQAVFFLSLSLQCRQFISIGVTTSQAIKDRFGNNSKIVESPQASNQAIVDLIKDNQHWHQQFFLHPCSFLADDTLVTQLSFLKYQRLNIYSLKSLPIPSLPSHNALFFFSPSSVKTFVKNYPYYDFSGKEVFTLGATTMQCLKNLNITSQIYSS